MQGKHHLSLPDRDIKWIRKLFEKAVAGFYDVVLSEKGWRVYAGKTQGWLVDQKSPGIDKLLPGMRTDVILDHEDTGRRIVIDTKFNAIVTRGWYSSETLRMITSSLLCWSLSRVMAIHFRRRPRGYYCVIRWSMYDEFAVIQDTKSNLPRLTLRAILSDSIALPA